MATPEQKSQYMHQYYLKHRDHILQMGKKSAAIHYQKNSEAVRARTKAYSAEITRCPVCDIEMRRGSLINHARSLKHLKNIEKQVKSEDFLLKSECQPSNTPAFVVPYSPTTDQSNPTY